MNKEKRILLYFISFLLGLLTTMLIGISDVFAATTQYWGSTVTQPKQAYFYDCNSSGCTTDYTSSNGIGYDSSGNEYGIYWAYDLNTVANSYGGIAVIRPDTQLLANKIYSTTVYMCSESSYITPINLFSGSLSQIQSRSYPVDQLTGWGNADLGSSYPYARIELGNAISNPIINNCRAVSFIYTPEVNSTYIGFQFTTGSTVTGNQYLIGYNHEYLGDSESLSEEQVDTIINNQTTEINTNITNMQESISSDIQNTEDNINSNIDDMEQAIVDSNKETQDVIKDQFNSCRPSYNLINPDNILINKFVSGNNGLLLDSTVTNTTDYIEVISGIYTFSYNYSNLLNSNQRTYVYYDINKNFIIGYNYDPNKKQNILNIPNNAYYVRISYDKNVFDLQLIKGNYTQYEPYGEEICSNKLDETNDKLNDLNSSLNDSNVDGSLNSAGSFFDSFTTTDHGGLSGIITAPLIAINQMLNTSCSAMTTTFKGKELSLPCGYEFWNRLGAIQDFINIVLGGMLCYRIIIKLYKLIERIKNPEDDRLEVMDL